MPYCREDGDKPVKITIVDKLPSEEEEIIIKCDYVDENMCKLLNRFKQGQNKLNLYQNGSIMLMEPKDIYYFESVDQRVYAYGQSEVYETKSKLYELEEELPVRDFLRISKSTIINLNKIKSLSPALGGRFEALLKNGEKLIISRQYVSDLKEVLGL